MKRKTTQFCAIVASVGLLYTGYGAATSSEFPGQTVLLAAGDDAPINPAPTEKRVPDPVEIHRIPPNHAVQAQATIIQHKATERQRKIAQMHAISYVKQLDASIKHLGPKKQAEAIQKKRKTRYIAVDTGKNSRTSPKAKKVIMVWDRQSESLVGHTVYDLPDPPEVGKKVTVTTYAAEYVGGSD